MKLIIEILLNELISVCGQTFFSKKWIIRKTGEGNPSHQKNGSKIYQKFIIT